MPNNSYEHLDQEFKPKFSTYLIGFFHWLEYKLIPGNYLDWNFPRTGELSCSENYEHLLQPYPTSADLRSGFLKRLIQFSGKGPHPLKINYFRLSEHETLKRLKFLENLKELYVNLLKGLTPESETREAINDLENWLNHTIKLCNEFGQVTKKYEYDWRSWIRSLNFINNSYTGLILVSTFSLFQFFEIFLSRITLYSSAAVIGVLLLIEMYISYERDDELQPIKDSIDESMPKLNEAFLAAFQAHNKHSVSDNEPPIQKRRYPSYDLRSRATSATSLREEPDKDSENDTVELSRRPRNQ